MWGMVHTVRRLLLDRRGGLVVPDHDQITPVPDDGGGRVIKAVRFNERVTS